MAKKESIKKHTRMEKQRIYVDMDGTLATWNPDKSLEEVAMPGYYRNLSPMVEVVQAIREILQFADYDVYILSSVLHKKATEDKNYWLDTYLPEIPMDHRIFVPYGEVKSEHIPLPHQDNDILIDDFSKNLREWHGVGIKLLNGINGTKGTWKGYVVNGRSCSNVIRNTIVGISMLL